MAEFTDKVVLVTGAGRGIGWAAALAFARAGAALAINDLTPINLDQTLAQLKPMGVQARDYVFDLAKKMPTQEMVEQVLEDFGRIDILVNNAGVHPLAPLLDMDEWDLRRTLDVNLCGPFFTIQHVGRAMRAQGGGVIVNIAASLAAAQAWPDSAGFIASKAGLIGLTVAAARELAPYNIRVNAVCPGFIETEGQRLLDSKAARSGSQAPIPPMRPGQPEEAAELVLFLCSPAASHINGQAINMDGGFSGLNAGSGIFPASL